jgi:hypothetical protein
MKSTRFWFLLVSVVSIAFSSTALSQDNQIPGQTNKPLGQTGQSPLSKDNLELSLGYVHASGDSGLNGFDVGAALWFSRRVSIAFNYERAANSSTLGNFGLTTAGLISTKSTLQNWLFGPRIFFPNKQFTSFEFIPFGEFQIGASHLSQSLSQTGVPSQSASDTAGTWMLGGGADYVFNPHWAARVNLDLLRTHFANTGQSRFRFVLGINYTFARRRQSRRR